MRNRCHTNLVITIKCANHNNSYMIQKNAILLDFYICAKLEDHYYFMSDFVIILI